MKRISLLLTITVLLAACSTTSNIPEDDQLFTGLSPINYPDDDGSQHAADLKEELEIALSTTPNGALFGSPYYRSPFPVGLWIWNAYSQKKSVFARWMTKSFGRQPVLISQVNPALRASVARSVLKSNGYFRGDVTYDIVQQKNPRKSKISYTVHLDSLFTYDSIAYVGFPASIRQLIDSATTQHLHSAASDLTSPATGGTQEGHSQEDKDYSKPFTATALETERNNITHLLRNNGYYFFNSSYLTFLADTLATPGKALLRLQLADETPNEALRQWHIGNTSIRLRRTMREQLTDSTVRRHLHVYYSGKRSPIRTRVILKDLRLRPRQLFSYDDYLQSASRLSANNVFSSVDFQFTPRPLTDSLDLTLSCTFDKPYDFYIESSLIGRTIGRYGPEIRMGVTRRNAFRGAEKLDINLHGSYEWQKNGGSSSNSYQYGADASVEFPRIVLPWALTEKRPRRPLPIPGEKTQPAALPSLTSQLQRSTLLKASTDIVRRPGYYKMHIAAGEWTYRWESSLQSRHEFSPITVKYQYMNTRTEKLDSILSMNPFLMASMSDYFIPKMRYTYVYTSPSNYRNPIRWEITLEESGNVTALWDLAGGHAWNQKEKTLFKNPYAQFLRLETDFTKTWTLTPHSSLVGHINAGVLRPYGNTSEDDTPYSEKFYAGGANSIRAFTVRSIGPGSFSGISGNRQFSYVIQNGNIKFVANLEYRTRLFGSLNGAVFLDMGNVWNWKDIQIDTDEANDEPDDNTNDIYNTWFTDTRFHTRTFLRQLALGTGAGLRYDLGFLVIRIDWGIALHAPYDTGTSGYFNINHFRDAHTLHFAIGYPF